MTPDSAPAPAPEDHWVIYPWILALEIFAWLLTAVAVAFAGYAAGVLGLWVVIVLFALMTSVCVLGVRLGPGPEAEANNAVHPADGLPAMMFVFACFLGGLGCLSIDAPAGLQKTFGELEPYFSAGAQVSAGLVIALAIEGRGITSGNPRDRSMFRQGILQACLAGAASLVALFLHTDLEAQAFCAVVVAAGLVSAFAAVLFLPSRRTRAHPD
jgi:hypothetical protein